MCGAENADLALCKGEPKTSAAPNMEEETPAPPNGEDAATAAGVQAMIDALPEAVTEDNEADLRKLLEEILTLYDELSAEDQELVDLTHCIALQAALEPANPASNTVTENVPQQAIPSQNDFSGVVIAFSGGGQADDKKILSDTYYKVIEGGKLDSAGADQLNYNIYYDSASRILSINNLKLEGRNSLIVPGITIEVIGDNSIGPDGGIFVIEDGGTLII